MTEEEHHQYMRDEWARQAREEVKNRFRISAKLTDETYPALMEFCKEQQLSVNSALRRILSDYFNLAS
ncbi:MAG: hypothetical protein ACO28M_09170 [Vulcanococcus sp.]